MIYTHLLNVARHALASCVSSGAALSVFVIHSLHTPQTGAYCGALACHEVGPTFFVFFSSSFFSLHEPSGGWNRQHFRFSFFPHFSVFLCCREASGKTQARQTVSLPRQHPKRGCYHLLGFFPHTKMEVKNKRQLNGDGKALFVDYIQIQGKSRFSSNLNCVSNFKLGHFLTKPLILDVYSFCLSILTCQVVKLKENLRRTLGKSVKKESAAEACFHNWAGANK